MFDTLPPRWSRFVAALSLGAGVVGCADVPRPDEPASRALVGIESSAQRERRLTQLWSGRPRAALEREWGAPAQILEIPGFRSPATMVLMFTGRHRAGGCIDAFVVLKDDAQTIWTYICR